jgi:integrase
MDREENTSFCAQESRACVSPVFQVLHNPAHGRQTYKEVAVEALEVFRIYPVEECELSIKTARNVMDGSLRAMFRDAGRRIEKNPFLEIPDKWWPTLPRKDPDLFSEEERDAILKFYKANRPYKAYAFVYFRFYTGTRPSEAAALKWGEYRSRTWKSRRIVVKNDGRGECAQNQSQQTDLVTVAQFVELLKTILPLHVRADDYV